MKEWNPEAMASADIYRFLFEGNPLPMWLFAEETGDCLAANPAAASLLGCSREEFRGQKLGDFSRLPAEPLDSKSAQSNPTQTRYFKTREGQELSLLVATQTWDGSPSRLQAMTVISQPAATREWNAAQRRNLWIAETAGEGILQTDRQWRIVFANPPLGAMLGVEASQLIGRALTEFLEEESRISFQKHMTQRESRLRETYELKWKTRQGPPKWTLVNAVPLLDETGQFEGSLAMITDVSEQRGAHQALQESDNRYRTLAAAADEGMGIVENGIIIDATPRLGEMVGLKVEALVGRPVVDFVAPEHRKMVRQKMLAQEETPYEHKMLRADGTTLQVEARSRHMVYCGRPVRMTAILDISERKKYEELLRATITLLTLGNQALNTQEYADKLVDSLQEWAQCPSVGVRLFGEDGRIHCHSGKGFEETFWQNTESLLGQKKCVCSRLAQGETCSSERLSLTSRGSFYSSHLSKFLPQLTAAERAEYCGLLFQGQYESLAIIPIRAERRTWGLVYLADPSPLGLKEHQIQFVEVLAPQIGATLAHHRLEANLRDSETNLRQAESMAKLGYWNSNLITGQVKWSEETWRILGYEPEKHTASMALMLARVHPEDRQRVEQAIADSAQKCRPYFCEFRVVLPSGIIRQVRDHGEPSGPPGQPPTRAFGVLMDITEQKLAEEELRRYENIIANTPDGVAFLDREYRYRIINPVYEKYSGRPREKLIGHTVAEHLGETAFQEQVKPRFDRCLAGETVTFQDWFDYPDLGRRFFTITYFPYRDARHHLTGVVVSSRDITELKQAEEVYRRLAAIVEHTDDAIIVITLAGVITNWNAGASRMYGYAEAEMVGQPLTRLAAPSHRKDIAFILGKIMAGEHVRHFESLWQKNDGAPLHVSLTISPLKTAEGNLIGASAIGRDITRRKQVEAALQAAQALTQRHLMFSETLLAAMPIPVFYKDAAGRYLGCNPAFTELIGLSQEEIKGKTVNALWSREISNPYDDKDQELLRHPHGSQNYESVVLDKHGERRTVLFAKRAFFNEANQLAGLVGAFLDITDRKQAEKNLRLRERAIDASNEGICLIGSVFKDSPLLYVNQGFEQLTGYSRQEVLGKNMRFLQGPDTDPLAVAQLRGAALSGLPITLELINYRKDSTPFWNRISLTPSRDEEEKSLLSVAVLTDVSRQRQTEWSLRRRESELATIQDHAPFLLCLLDQKLLLLQCNKTFRDFVAQPENQLNGKHICTAMGCMRDHPAEANPRWDCANCALLQTINMALAGDKKPAMLEQELALQLGVQVKTYTFLLSVALLKLDDGPRVLLFLEDITTRKKAEVQLYESRQMLQALSRRLVEAEESARRSVARELHDRVGQNLTLFNINLGIIRNELLRAPTSDALNRLDDSMRLVNETMDHVRNVIADLRPAVLDDYGLAAALRWSSEQLEARTGLRIEVTAAPEFPRLEAAVETAVFRIVQEALTNVVRHARARQVRIQMRLGTAGPQVSVRDDGVGFVPPPPHAPNLHDTWGLATMRERAEAIGAHWRLHSAPGQGTEIVIDFPPLVSP